NARSDRESAFVGLFRNGWVWAAIGLSMSLQVAVVYVPFLQHAFSTVPLSAADWGLCTVIGSSVLWVRELTKIATRALRKTDAPLAAPA
ncbi:MAG TPA: cation-translocating P-type ATPase C-terminal domain-containing protein, partial [Verrucomicrobium sp.]|nr:cation-translocating P-type ATPase C-terminal domain-containing protein [Verrucomicrobium sp.]